MALWSSRSVNLRQRGILYLRGCIGHVPWRRSRDAGNPPILDSKRALANPSKGMAHSDMATRSNCPCFLTGRSNARSGQVLLMDELPA